MKQFVSLLFCLLFFIVSSWSQVPLGLNYQAVLRNSDGQTLADESVTVEVSIINAGGSVAFLESISSRSNQVGLLTLKVGENDPALLDNINWASTSYSMKVNIRLSDGTLIEGQPALILPVPYAFVAQEVVDEKQKLAINGNDLTISGSDGNTVKLPSSTGGEKGDPGPKGDTGAAGAQGPVGSSIWRKEGTKAVYDEGNVEVGKDLEVRDDIFIYDNNTVKVGLFNIGLLGTYGDNSNLNVLLTNSTDNNNLGSVLVYNEQENRRVRMGVSLSANSGFLETFGANDEGNASLTTLNNYPNNGYVSVRDANGNIQAGVYVDSEGTGYIFADGANGGVKSFRMKHPEKPGKDIWYASMEGPEAGAYERGTSKLVNGEAFIPFSEHFQIVINPTTMTVNLTPLSANTMGLAVVEKTETGIRVKELQNGKGNFEFDWEVKAVRKGFENYRVIRDRSESEPTESSKEIVKPKKNKGKD